MTTVNIQTNFYKSRQQADPNDLEALRKEVERLQGLAELGRMAATVAHEVRNPLAGISANAELLHESITDPDDQACVTTILAEVERLSRLVDDLLLYTRERPPALTLIDLASLARSVADLCARDAAARGVSLVANGSGLAQGDVDLSQQALLNIVRNGIQACRAGKEVAIEITAERIAVRDQGSGITPEIRSRLFEPFTAGKTRGLGLGLAVARRCLRRQGGDISLLTTGPEGTVFLLRWMPG